MKLHAGELILHVGDPAGYSHVDASVTSGGLGAPPFHEDHGGLFRSFEKSGNGKYRLQAHVGLATSPCVECFTLYFQSGTATF